MATYTYVDIYIEEAAKLADLGSVLWDFRRTQGFARLLNENRQNLDLIEPLSIAIAVTYCRPFMTGVRRRLGDSDLMLLTPKLRVKHDHIMNYRSKHVAHSVNHYEENIPCANYCVERVAEEGITSIGYSSGRVVGLNGVEVAAVQELAGIFESHVKALIHGEQERLLPIVRNMPLEQVLAGGQKPFTVDPLRATSRKRKRWRYCQSDQNGRQRLRTY